MCKNHLDKKHKNTEVYETIILILLKCKKNLPAIAIKSYIETKMSRIILKSKARETTVFVCAVSRIWPLVCIET